MDAIGKNLIPLKYNNVLLRGEMPTWSIVKDSIKRAFFYDTILELCQKRQVNKWLDSDRSSSPPHYYKQIVLKDYAEKHELGVLVETGTYYGQMVYAMKNEFDHIYSIELSKELYHIACKRFDGYDHIHLSHGDSADILPVVLDQVGEEPALFWLDGHYSGGQTAGKGREVPVLKELKSILTHSMKRPVILIDDARLFTGKDEYPSLSDIENYIQKISTDWVMNVEEDIIRIRHNR